MDNKLSNIKERALLIAKYHKVSYELFSENIGMTYGSFKGNAKRSPLNSDAIENILTKYPDVSPDWLLTGQGEMLKSDNDHGVRFHDPDNAPLGKRLIPLYDDSVATIGGNNGIANTNSSSYVTEWIDPGDWFKGATDAIRHYEDSMIEYPSGCILALKKVQDRMQLVPGKDYVVETTELRVTKKIQLGADDTYIRCHSTNTETYPDGTLIHQPFNIKLIDVINIFEILGYVVKKGGGAIVSANNK